MSADRRLVIVLAVVLAATGATFSLARQSSYRATVKLTPATRGVLKPSIRPAYLRGLLRDGGAELRVRLERSGVEPSLVDSVRIRGSAFRPVVRVSAAAGTPDRARELVTKVVRQLDGLSAVELAGAARAALVSTRARLADPLLAADERAELTARDRSIRHFLRAPRGRFGASQPVAQRPARWADRVVAALPGRFPQRPHPLSAAAVGLLAGGLIAAIAALARRRTAWLEGLA
jgi:hypothetical protein